MSLTSRILRPPIRIPASRAYSSFFSSNGGRHFNPAKTAKVVVAPKKNGGGVGGSNASGSKPSSDTSARASSSVDPTEAEKDHSSPPAPSPSQAAMTTPSFAPTPQYHPLVGAKEFKLHQFFSLHRPLLLLSAEPHTILQSAPSDAGLFGRQAQEATPPSPFSSHLDLSEAEADAETARQLTRALTMSQAGSMADWENTLRRLGWDDGRAEVKAQMAEEWNEVVMDSVKRKRRKKMKKHKLKKRRRVSNSALTRLCSTLTHLLAHTGFQNEATIELWLHRPHYRNLLCMLMNSRFIHTLEIRIVN